MTNDYEAALRAFCLSPSLLTLEMIETLTKVDTVLGERATTKRAAALVADAQARQRAARGEPSKRPAVSMEALAEETSDAILVSLIPLKQRVASLEAENASLLRKHADLEQRLDAIEAPIVSARSLLVDDTRHLQ